jgi:hypothetical protein
MQSALNPVPLVDSRVRCFLLHVAAPVVIGDAIYTCWRTPTLMIFRWYDQIGLSPSITNLRGLTLSFRAVLPGWVLFAVPDGLWVYSLTALMGMIWQTSKYSSSKIFWVSFALTFSIAGEIGQAAGVVPGTFDFIDVILSFVAAAAAINSVGRNRFKKGVEESESRA